MKKNNENINILVHPLLNKYTRLSNNHANSHLLIGIHIIKKNFQFPARARDILNPPPRVHVFPFIAAAPTLLRHRAHSIFRVRAEGENESRRISARSATRVDIGSGG